MPAKLQVEYTKTRIRLDSKEKTVDFIKKLYAQRSRLFVSEYSVNLYLSKNNTLICWEIHTMGVKAATLIDTQRVCATALLVKADKVVNIHNHPSNGSIPSESDIKFGNTLEESLAKLNVELLNIYIFTEQGVWSFISKLRGINRKYFQNVFSLSQVKEPSVFSYFELPKQLKFSFKPTIFHSSLTQDTDTIRFLSKYSLLRSNGIILLNTTNSVIGFVKVPFADLSNYKKQISVVRKVLPFLPAAAIIMCQGFLKDAAFNHLSDVFKLYNITIHTFIYNDNGIIKDNYGSPISRG